MKKIYPVIHFFLVILFLCGCGQESYTLSCPSEEIEKVEIIYVPPYRIVPLQELHEIEPIATILQEDQISFFNVILDLPCIRGSMDPLEGITNYSVRVTYQNGSVEWISSNSGCYYDNEKYQWKHFSFDHEEFNRVVSSYTQDNERGQGDGSVVPIDKS